MARPRRSSAASETSSNVPDRDQELGSMYDYLAKVILLGPSGAGKSCLLHRFVKNEWRVFSSQTIGVEFSSKIIKIGTGVRRKRMKLQLWDTAGTERFRSVSRSYYRGAAGAILVYDVASTSSFTALPTFLMDARALASPHLTVLLAGNKTDLCSPSSSSVASSPSMQIPIPYDQNENSLKPHTTFTAPTSNSSVSSRHSVFPLESGSGSLRSTGTGPTGSIGMGFSGSKLTATVASEGREVTPEQASRWASTSNIPVAVEVSALSGENVEELFSRLARMILTKIELGEIDPDDPQSGIQYGDGGTWAGGLMSDGGSVKSALTLEGNGADDLVTGNSSRRKKRATPARRKNGWISGVGEWEEVFRLTSSNSRRGGGCC